ALVAPSHARSSPFVVRPLRLAVLPRPLAPPRGLGARPRPHGPPRLHDGQVLAPVALESPRGGPVLLGRRGPADGPRRRARPQGHAQHHRGRRPGVDLLAVPGRLDGHALRAARRPADAAAPPDRRARPLSPPRGRPGPLLPLAGGGRPPL